MKLFVCCLLVIANISNNGKASLESFLPTSTNVLFEDTTRNTDKSCYRPCKFNVKPRRCYYDFKIEPIVIDGRPALTVNRVTPGPRIHVCVNDVVIVKVHNRVPDQDIAIHWHGMQQKGTPYMDGVPMVTQCPIAYGSTYKYAFKATSAGTFFYHSDSVSHQSDGVYGSLIVNQPQPLEPHSSLYDYDRSDENTLLIAAKFPELLTANVEEFTIAPEGLIINGQSDSYKLFVLPDFAYRLRLINAVGVECPVTVKVDSHDMVIIATDGKPVKPTAAGKVTLYPGERMDVTVRASQENGGYWIRTTGGGACAGLNARSMLIYSGFNYTSMLQEQNIRLEDASLESTVSGQMLQSHQDVGYSANVKTYYFGIDRNIVKFKETDNDFRYLSDALPKKPFFPASLSVQESGVVQINNKNFLYPNTPILLRPRDVNAASICLVGNEENHQEPQCIQTLNAVEGETVEIALVNEGFGSNDSYTFHMHGYSMQVIATWRNPDSLPISREHFQRLEREGKIIRNTQHPPQKDTINVPNKGFTIIRIKPDQGGSWLLECRSCAMTGLPTAVLIQVPQPLPKSVVDSLPKCGNFRPPDVLLA